MWYCRRYACHTESRDGPVVVGGTCDARPGARLAFIRKRRADGTVYHVPAMLGGERCTEDAIVSFYRDGHNVHRCIAHLRWEPDDPRKADTGP